MRGYKRSQRGLKVKIEQKEIEYVARDEGKRIRLNIDKYVKKFEEVFSIDKKEIKYCSLEKCRIIAETGKKIVKKGQMVPQSLRKDTELHLEDLVRRKVIRE